MAQRYSVPIVPIFSFSQANKVKVLVGNVFYPATDYDLPQNISNQFMPILKTYPEQWVFWGK